MKLFIASLFLEDQEQNKTEYFTSRCINKEVVMFTHWSNIKRQLKTHQLELYISIWIPSNYNHSLIVNNHRWKVSFCERKLFDCISPLPNSVTTWAAMNQIYWTGDFRKEMFTHAFCFSNLFWSLKNQSLQT